MKNPGGYLLMDFTGVEINSEEAVTIVDPVKAEILRNNNKPVYIYGVVMGPTTLSVTVDLVTDTGARDGKVYGFMGTGSTLFNISTDDNNITFTPV